MPTIFDPATGGIIVVPQDKENEIIVKNAEQLSGVLDSGKVYFIDGLIDVTSIVPILVPSGGMYTGGHGYGISGLYSTGASDVMFQTPNAKHTISSDATGGTFTLTYDGQTTSALNWNATAAQVDTALEALSNIGIGDVTCTGGDFPVDIVIEFTGTLAKTDVAVITVTDSTTGGTVTIAETIAGYSGDFIVQNAFFYQSGAGSQLFDIDNDGNNSAFELNSVNLGRFGPVTPSLGTVANYRQFRTGDFACINFTDGFTFDGNVMGFALNDSIGLSIVSGSTYMQEGTALAIEDGFSSNINYLSATGTSEFCDFQDSNFTGTAVMALSNFRTSADDAIPNIAATSIRALFKSCVGVDNTFIGAYRDLTTVAATIISTADTYTKCLGTTTATVEAHFTAIGNNRLKYIGLVPIAVTCTSKGNVTTGGTESLEFAIRHYDDSASAFTDNLDEDPTETALKLLGDRQGKFNLVGVTIMDTDDYLELFVKNISNTNNPTVSAKSKFLISQRV